MGKHPDGLFVPETQPIIIILDPNRTDNVASVMQASRMTISQQRVAMPSGSQLSRGLLSPALSRIHTSNRPYGKPLNSGTKSPW